MLRVVSLAVFATASLAFADPSAKQAAQANNTFGWKLFQQVVADEAKQQKDTNILVSPLSASIALAMAQAGATGTTLKEMLGTLGYPGTDVAASDALTDAIGALAKDLLGRKTEEVIHTANLVVSNKDAFRLEPTYENMIKSKYNFTESEQPPVMHRSFSDQSTLDGINDWVKLNTDKQIKEILKKLDPEMVAILLNALLFQGKWASQFEARATYNTSKIEEAEKGEYQFGVPHFTSSTGKKVDDVEMMKSEVSYGFNDTKDFQLISLPFCAKSHIQALGNQKKMVCDTTGDFALDLIVPKNKGTAYSMVAKLDLATYQKAVAAMKTEDNELHVPKFKFEYGLTSPKSLKDALRNQGMKSAFVSRPDHFSRLGVPYKKKNIFIQDVLQKTAVEMEEGGFKASAVTAVVLSLESARGGGPLKVDRAFAFFLRDRVTGALLFQGVASHPQWK